jgi:hypothetical protein
MVFLVAQQQLEALGVAPPLVAPAAMPLMVVVTEEVVMYQLETSLINSQTHY